MTAEDADWRCCATESAIKRRERTFRSGSVAGTVFRGGMSASGSEGGGGAAGLGGAGAGGGGGGGGRGGGGSCLRRSWWLGGVSRACWLENRRESHRGGRGWH